MSTSFMIIYVIILLGIFYFIGIAPQKKEKMKKEEMMNSLNVGDYVVTTAGMYGQIIDITNEMVIVEFGSKSCRIPMLKQAIANVERPDVMAKGEVSEETKKAE